MSHQQISSRIVALCWLIRRRIRKWGKESTPKICILSEFGVRLGVNQSITGQNLMKNTPSFKYLHCLFLIEREIRFFFFQLESMRCWFTCNYLTGNIWSTNQKTSQYVYLTTISYFSRALINEAQLVGNNSF